MIRIPRQASHPGIGLKIPGSEVIEMEEGNALVLSSYNSISVCIRGLYDKKQENTSHQHYCDDVTALKNFKFFLTATIADRD